MMIAEALEVKKECYFAILLDRATSGPVMVASAEGGMYKYLHVMHLHMRMYSYTCMFEESMCVCKCTILTCTYTCMWRYAITVFITCKYMYI